MGFLPEFPQLLSVQGLASNIRAAISSPQDWGLSRRSVVQYGAIQHIDELESYREKPAGFARAVYWKLAQHKVVSFGFSAKLARRTLP